MEYLSSENIRLEEKLKEACQIITDLHGDQAFYVDVNTRDFINNNIELFPNIKALRLDEK